MTRILCIAAGTLLALIGAVVFVSPFPLGFVFLLPGFALLVHGSRRFAAWVRVRRARHVELNERTAAFTASAPAFLARPLRRTDPHVGPRVRTR